MPYHCFVEKGGEMDPIQAMELHKAEFTKNDQQIYETIMGNPDQVTYRSITKLAEACGVSQSALSRFVKTIGYSRYQEFRSDLTAWVAQQQVSEDPNRLFYFERLERLLLASEQVLTGPYMHELAKYVLGFDQLFATGIGKSYQPALLLQALARKMHVFVHDCPSDMLHEYADHMGKNDLIIVFSVSARGEIMERIRNHQGKVLLVTTNASHAYQDMVDRTVILPFLPPDPETCSVSPVLFDVFVELLISYMSDEFTKEKIAHV